MIFALPINPIFGVALSNSILSNSILPNLILSKSIPPNSILSTPLLLCAILRRPFCSQNKEASTASAKAYNSLRFSGFLHLALRCGPGRHYLTRSES